MYKPLFVSVVLVTIAIVVFMSTELWVYLAGSVAIVPWPMNIGIGIALDFAAIAIAVSWIGMAYRDLWKQPNQ